jgi:O-antigen ligase
MVSVLQSLPFVVFLFILPFPGTVALRLMCLVAMALIAAFSWRSLAPPPVPCRWAIALWAGVVLASLVWAVDPAYSLREIKNEIGYSLAAGITFFAWTRDEGRLRLAGLALLAGFTAISVSVISGYAWHGEWPAYAFYGGFGAISTYLVTVCPVLILAIVSWRPRDAGRWVVASGLLFLAVALLSVQRVLWPAIALQAVLSGAWLWRTAGGPLKSSRLVWTSLVLLALLAGGLYASERLRTKGNSDAPTAMQQDLRPHFWKEVILRIAEHPLRGAGFGQRAMSKAYPDLIPAENPLLWHAHNLVLNYGISEGIPGMIAVLVLFAAIGWRFWRLALAGRRPENLAGLAGAVMVLGVFTRNMTNDFFMRDGALLFWAIAGMLFGYALRRPKRLEIE